MRNFHCELFSLTFSFTTQGAYVMHDKSHQHGEKANQKQTSISSPLSDSKHMLDWWAAKKLVIFLWVVFGESGFFKLVETHVVVSLALSHFTLLFYYCCLFQINEYLVVCTFCRYWRLFVWRRARFCGSLMVLHRAVGNMVNARDMSVCEEAAVFARCNRFWH